jgi:hypothetical protein
MTSSTPKIEAEIGSFWREQTRDLREALIVHLETVAFDVKQAMASYSWPNRDPGGDFALRWACVHLEQAVKARDILKRLEAEGDRDAA